MASESKKRRPVGIGTGYLSLMMIFVVLCLTMLAALSVSAADNERKFSEKSAEYTKAYYAADVLAKEKLAAADGIVKKYSDYGDFMLLAELEDIKGVSCEQVMGGLETSWTTPINQRQDLYCKVKFSGGGFHIAEWRTVSAGETEEKPLNVLQVE